MMASGFNTTPGELNITRRFPVRESGGPSWVAAVNLWVLRAKLSSEFSFSSTFGVFAMTMHRRAVAMIVPVAIVVGAFLLVATQPAGVSAQTVGEVEIPVDGALPDAIAPVPDPAAPGSTVPETTVPMTVPEPTGDTVPSPPPVDPGSPTGSTIVPPPASDAPVDVAVVDAPIGVTDSTIAPELIPVVERAAEPTPEATTPVAIDPDIAEAIAEDEPVEFDLPLRPEEGWPVRSIRFPVAGAVSYYDDWAACRGGPECPRHHMGNDIIGVRLQPLLAATDGEITHLVVDHPTAGWGFVITDHEGWDYRYYHVNNDTPGTDDAADDGLWRFADGIKLGSKVTAGQVVAFMGDSGNSEYSVPHVHFEIHRPDGEPVNPHVSLRLAEWVDSCLNRGSYVYQSPTLTFTFELPHATVVPNGEGKLLVQPSGWFIPYGDAATVGDARHERVDPKCDSSYAAIVNAYR